MQMQLVLGAKAAALAMQGLDEVADADFPIAQSGKTAPDLFSLYLNCHPEGKGVARVQREDEVLMALGYMYSSLRKYGG